MPHLSLRLSPNGPIFEFFVAVSVPLSEALKKLGKPSRTLSWQEGLLIPGRAVRALTHPY